MPIDPLNSGQIISTSKPTKSESTPPQSGAATESKEMAGTAKPKITDSEIIISDEMLEIEAISKGISNKDAYFDQDKVADIKAAIAEGRYKVDSKKLAESMMKHNNELAFYDNASE